MQRHTAETPHQRHRSRPSSSRRQRRQWTIARAGIAAAELVAGAATKAREVECGTRGPLCREREGDERAALSALNSAIVAPMPAVATIADADPQVTAALRLATWAGLDLKTDDVVNLRRVLMALLPNIAGLVLASGVALRKSADGVA